MVGVCVIDARDTIRGVQIRAGAVYVYVCISIHVAHFCFE